MLGGLGIFGVCCVEFVYFDGWLGFVGVVFG